MANKKKAPKKKVKKKTHINEVVDAVVDVASEILKYRAGIAMGKKPPIGHENFNAVEQQKIIDLVKPMIQSVQQTRTIEAESSKDIIEMLTQGKITVKEAIDILTLMKTQVKVESEELQNDLQKTLMDTLKEDG